MPTLTKPGVVSMTAVSVISPRRDAGRHDERLDAGTRLEEMSVAARLR